MNQACEGGWGRTTPRPSPLSPVHSSTGARRTAWRSSIVLSSVSHVRSLLLSRRHQLMNRPTPLPARGPTVCVPSMLWRPLARFAPLPSPPPHGREGTCRGGCPLGHAICITRCQRGTEGDFLAYGASSARAAGDETGKHFQTETLPSTVSGLGRAPPIVPCPARLGRDTGQGLML